MTAKTTKPQEIKKGDKAKEILEEYHLKGGSAYPNDAYTIADKELVIFTISKLTKKHQEEMEELKKELDFLRKMKCILDLITEDDPHLKKAVQKIMKKSEELELQKTHQEEISRIFEKLDELLEEADGVLYEDYQKIKAEAMKK